MEALAPAARQSSAPSFSGRLGAPERGVKTIEIEGIPVEFPFEPYDCQRAYMGQVIKALREGKNALLESPTGTGKTLCLLCSSLAWRESIRGSLKATGWAPAIMPAPPPGSSAPASSMPGQGGAAAGQQQSRGPMSEGAVLVKQELGVSVDPALAHLPPALQLVLSAQQNQSGVAAALGGAAAQGASLSAEPKLPTIVYASRTHSQLTQVIRELQRCSYRNRVTSTVLSSRAQSCLNPKVTKLPRFAANQACRVLTASKKCGFYNNLKYNVKKTASWQAQLESPVPDMEDLIRVGREMGLCPYYMAKDAAKEADVVFMPYNYLLDPSIRKTMLDSISWDNAIVIFDEAHNVEQVCADSSSFDITSKTLTDAIAEARRCREICLTRIEQGTSAYDPLNQEENANMNARQLFNDLEILLGVFKGLEQGLGKVASKMPRDGQTRPGGWIFEFLTTHANINENTVSILNTTIDRATEAVQANDADRGASTNSKTNAAMQHIQSCLNLAFMTRDPLSNRPGAPPAHKGYRVHVHWEKSWGADKIAAPTLSFWCFIPGMAMRMLSALSLRSILLTSGTLAPLDSFAYELQLPFDVQLENPHIVSPSQVWVGVLQTGPMGHQLCSSYKERDNQQYKDDLGIALVNIARLVPDGLLVFFPSYHTLNGCLEHWKSPCANGGPTIWERITRHKAPVIEPRDSALFTQAIEDYKTKLDDPATQGAVFFAVCKGKVSEGLDFSDRAGRGVVITGIPYAQAVDPKVRLKREVLDEERRSTGSHKSAGQGLSGEAWYLQSAMRAVNQAMGRVIRHRWDYGAIILADRRFGEPTTQKGLSKWLQSYVNVHSNFGSAAGSLTRFFKDKADAKAPGNQVAKSAFQVVNNNASGSAAGQATHKHHHSSSNAGGSHSTTNLLDLVPAALDVSGLAAAAPSSRRRAAKDAAAAAGSASAVPSGTAAAAAAGGRSGSLLAMLQDEASRDSFRTRMSDVSQQGEDDAAGERDDGSSAATRDAAGGGAAAGSKLQALVDAGLSNTGPSASTLGSNLGASTSFGTSFTGRIPTSFPVPLPPPGPGAGSIPQRAKLTAGGASGGIAGGGIGAVGNAGGSVAGGGSQGGRRAGGRSALALSYDAEPSSVSLPLATSEQTEERDRILRELQAQQEKQQQQDTQAAAAAAAAKPPQPQQPVNTLARSSSGQLGNNVQGGSGALQPQQRPASTTSQHAYANNAQPASASGRQAAHASIGGVQGQGVGTAGTDRARLSSSMNGSGHSGGGVQVKTEGGQTAATAPMSAAGTRATGSGHVSSSSAVGTGVSGPTGSAAGFGVSGSGQAPKPALNPKEFLAQLKASLPAPLMEQVSILLKQYTSGKDAHKFIEGLLAALKGPRTVHLLPSFTAFIPRAERNWFSAMVDTHVKRYQQSQQNQHQPNGHTHTSTGIACGSGRQGMGTAQGMRPGQAARPQGPGAGQAGSGQQPMRQMTLQGRPASSGGPGVGTNSHGRMGSGPGMSGGGGGGFGVAITTDGKRILLGPGGSGPGVGASTAAGGVGASHNAAPSGAAAKGRSASAPPAAVLQPRQAATTAAPHPAAARTGLQRTHGAAVVAAAVKREPGMQVEGQVSKRPKSENAGDPCCMCGACPMDVPFAAPCGHTGCMSCWHSQIARHFKCAKCGREVRQRNLTRKYFS